MSNHRASRRKYKILNSFICFFLLFFVLVFLSNQIIVVADFFDSDNDGFGDELELAYDKDPNNSNDFPLDTDGDKTPNNASADGNFSGDLDDDNDKLVDLEEEKIGTNPLDSSDVELITIMDMDYFIFDSNDDNKFDKLYDGESRVISVEFSEGSYLIDLELDGNYDYIYSDGEVSKYYKETKQLEIPWVLVIATIIIVVIIVIAILFKLGILFLYEEYVEE